MIILNVTYQAEPTYITSTQSKVSCWSLQCCFQLQTIEMKALFVCCVCLLAGAGEAASTPPSPPTADDLSESLKKAYESYTLKAIKSTTGEDVASLKTRVATLARQLIMQQLFVEERVRSDGGSGIKQVRIDTLLGIVQTNTLSAFYLQTKQ